MSEKGAPVTTTYEIMRADGPHIRVYTFKADERIIAVASYNAWRDAGETVSFSTVMTSVERYTTTDRIGS